MNQRDFYQSLPRKRMSAGALLFNEREELLIVKPTYKDHWLIPGGSVEENESPGEGCLREVREEIGIAIKGLRLLCMDYVPAHEEKTEGLHFIFYGGIVSEKDITLAKDELSEYRFLEVSDAIPFLGRNFGKRLPKCIAALKQGVMIYLEHGEN
jgi:ADP-ribose pyrophosphatase YjhB (NUDIX family)